MYTFVYLFLGLVMHESIFLLLTANLSLFLSTYDNSMSKWMNLCYNVAEMVYVKGHKLPLSTMPAWYF